MTTNAKPADSVTTARPPVTAKPSRRNFLAAASGAVFSFTIVPRHVLGGPGQVPPSERINLAGVGAGGMGGGRCLKNPCKNGTGRSSKRYWP
jgi:hypothetical protein